MSQPIEITRELLERYLRAMGAPFNDSERRLLDGCGGLWIEVIAHTRNVPRDWLGFKLGLCAAAEMALERTFKITSLSHGPGFMAARAQSRILAGDLLRAAGIDPAAWEAAR